MKNDDTKTMHTQMDKANVTCHQSMPFNVGGSIDPIPVQWVDHALCTALIINTAPSTNKFSPSMKGCSKGLSKSLLPLVSPIDLEPGLPKPKPMPGASTDPSYNMPVRFPGIKPTVPMSANSNCTPITSTPFDPVPAAFMECSTTGPISTTPSVMYGLHDFLALHSDM